MNKATKSEKEELINKLQRESAINNSLSNLVKDVLSIETQLKANATALDEEELVNICKKYIPNIEGLRKDIAAYLSK